MIWHKRLSCAQVDGFQPQARFMRLALAQARQNLHTPAGGPFGACIVKDGEVIALARNTVLAARDATCHAEINALRHASAQLGRFDLSGCVIYSTTEPCPMCFAAIHWAGLARIVYGTRIGDVRRLGFKELTVSNQQMQRLGHSPVRLTGGFLRAECRALLEHWAAAPSHPVY